ncbi:MAG: 50S ribosomal protein L1 [Candidatus Hodarchaeales archaeon]
MEEFQGFSDAIKHVKDESIKKSRNFTESVELIVGFKDVNLKDPSNRFNIESLLPYEIKKDIKICIIAGGNIATQAANLGLTVISKEDLEALGKDTKRAKKFASSYDFFLAEPPLMGLAGRYLGRVLGPRGKIHKPIPPPAATDLNKFLSNYRRTVRLRIKSNPTFGVRIGTLTNNDEELEENAMTIYNTLVNKLPRGIQQIRRVFMKTTMGSPVSIIFKQR